MTSRIRTLTARCQLSWHLSRDTIGRHRTELLSLRMGRLQRTRLFENEMQVCRNLDGHEQARLQSGAGSTNLRMVTRRVFQELTFG
jgi:hypothetical protein